MHIIRTTILISLSMLSISANAALESRLGGLAYYDTEADLTWLADANAAVGSVYDTYDPGSGRMNWWDANAWAASLMVGGVWGWRLPSVIDVGNDGATYTSYAHGVDYGFNITAHSELSNMFYNVLGNFGYHDANGNSPQPGWGMVNTGPFSFTNIVNANTEFYPVSYWSAMEYVPDTDKAWYFAMDDGYQGNYYKRGSIHAWAVHSGDVGLVPVPAAIWLFGSALLGLVGMGKCRR